MPYNIKVREEGLKCTEVTQCLSIIVWRMTHRHITYFPAPSHTHTHPGPASMNQLGSVQMPTCSRQRNSMLTFSSEAPLVSLCARRTPWSWRAAAAPDDPSQCWTPPLPAQDTTYRHDTGVWTSHAWDDKCVLVDSYVTSWRAEEKTNSSGFIVILTVEQKKQKTKQKHPFTDQNFQFSRNYHQQTWTATV